MDDKLFKLYTMAVINYEKKFGSRVNEIEKLYPKNWNNDFNYEAKIKIISESIRENKLIKDTNIYNEYLYNNLIY